MSNGSGQSRDRTVGKHPQTANLDWCRALCINNLALHPRFCFADRERLFPCSGYPSIHLHDRIRPRNRRPSNCCTPVLVGSPHFAVFAPVPGAPRERLTFGLLAAELPDGCAKLPSRGHSDRAPSHPEHLWCQPRRLHVVCYTIPRNRNTDLTICRTAGKKTLRTSLLRIHQVRRNHKEQSNERRTQLHVCPPDQAC